MERNERIKRTKENLTSITNFIVGGLVGCAADLVMGGDGTKGAVSGMLVGSIYNYRSYFSRYCECLAEYLVDSAERIEEAKKTNY